MTIWNDLFRLFISYELVCFTALTRTWWIKMCTWQVTTLTRWVSQHFLRWRICTVSTRVEASKIQHEICSGVLMWLGWFIRIECCQCMEISPRSTPQFPVFTHSHQHSYASSSKILDAVYHHYVSLIQLKYWRDWWWMHLRLTGHSECMYAYGIFFVVLLIPSLVVMESAGSMHAVHSSCVWMVGSTVASDRSALGASTIGAVIVSPVLSLVLYRFPILFWCRAPGSTGSTDFKITPFCASYDKGCGFLVIFHAPVKCFMESCVSLK